MPHRRSYIDKYMHINQATFQYTYETRTCIPQFYVTNCTHPQLQNVAGLTWWRNQLKAHNGHESYATFQNRNVLVWLWHKFICIYFVCILYLYVYVVCMYTLFVCILAYVVHVSFVCILCLYVYFVCMYTLFVCILCKYTMFVYFICTYTLSVSQITHTHRHTPTKRYVGWLGGKICLRNLPSSQNLPWQNLRE